MKRPKSATRRYRNLHEYRGTIWYERVAHGRRYRENTEENPDSKEGWDRAAHWRDQYEADRGIGSPTAYAGKMPTVAEMAKRYLAEDTSHLAATTRTDRNSHLAPEGPIVRHLGPKRLDDITAATLREWWTLEIQNTERSDATGLRYVASIAGVLGYALALGFLRESPVDAFRKQLSRRARSKQGRAAAQSHARPITHRDAIARLVAEAKAEGPDAHALTLCLLDAGLRLGEAMGLRWRAIAWGVSENDRRRHIHVATSRSRDGEADAPKSGRTRRVQLSRRLRAALVALFEARRPRSLDAWVFEGMDGGDFREGPWAGITSRAELPGVTPKCLRDSFASWLVSSGIPLKYISRQLGHSTTGVTEAHYAAWIPGDGDFYVEPVRLAEGDVPADLLARLPDSPQSPHTGDPYALPESLKSARMQ